jgi:hypothetical protein
MYGIFKYRPAKISYIIGFPNLQVNIRARKGGIVGYPR